MAIDFLGQGSGGGAMPDLMALQRAEKDRELLLVLTSADSKSELNPVNRAGCEHCTVRLQQGACASDLPACSGTRQCAATATVVANLKRPQSPRSSASKALLLTDEHLVVNS